MHVVCADFAKARQLIMIGKKYFASDFWSPRPRCSPQQHQTKRKPRLFITQWIPLTSVMVREMSHWSKLWKQLEQQGSSLHANIKAVSGAVLNFSDTVSLHKEHQFLNGFLHFNNTSRSLLKVLIKNFWDLKEVWLFIATFKITIRNY